MVARTMGIRRVNEVDITPDKGSAWNRFRPWCSVFVDVLVLSNTVVAKQKWHSGQQKAEH